jgi:uncharacterized damage-inducible protein DinB
MSIAQTLLPEFDQEMKTTRAMLAVVPDAKAAWKPHAKSWSLGDLAMHVANLVSWTAITLKQTELDLNPPGGAGWKPRAFTTVEALVADFDANVKAAREAIAAARDEDLAVVWTLKSAGAKVFAMPRAACLRFFVMNHVIHHRGQLSVYLRLCDVPLPRVYGPTADVPH